MAPDDRPTGASAGGLWALWFLGCLIAPFVCWFFAFVTTMTFFGAEVSAESRGTAHALLYAGAVCATLSAALVVISAARGSRRRKTSGSTGLVVVLALLSPWFPLYVALGARVGGTD